MRRGFSLLLRRSGTSLRRNLSLSLFPVIPGYSLFMPPLFPLFPVIPCLTSLMPPLFPVIPVIPVIPVFLRFPLLFLLFPVIPAILGVYSHPPGL